MSQVNESPRLSPAEGGPSPPPARRGSISLQAAATLNAGLQLEEAGLQNGSISEGHSSLPSRTQTPSAERRRSQVLMNLQLADPTTPGPGEMVTENVNSGTSQLTQSPRLISASPRLIPSRRTSHHRAPSLGELHQELEAEQEYQVNRLLQQIRQLQDQLQRQQAQSGVSPATAGAAVVTGDEPSPSVPISIASPQPYIPSPGPGSVSGSLPRSPGFPRASFEMARHRSRTPSRHASPRLRATSIGTDASAGGEGFALGGRDESAYYQAETQMLVRENQMLRHRIRELERQLAELQGNNHAAITHEPTRASSLSRSVSISETDGGESSSAKPTPSASASSATPARETE